MQLRHGFKDKSFGYCAYSFTGNISSNARHYSDVTMGAIASQITSLAGVQTLDVFRRRSKKTSKLRVTGLCARNSPMTTQMASNAEMFLFDDFIMRFKQMRTFRNSWLVRFIPLT